MTGAPGLAAVALRGLCPRCGAPTLFAGLTAFAPACSRCGLAFAAHDVGDGPAGLLTLVVGALVIGMAAALELGVHPPVWVHLVWVPVALVLVVGSLRLTKALLLGIEVRTRWRTRSDGD